MAKFHDAGAWEGAGLYESLPDRKGCRYFLRVNGKTKWRWGFRSKAAVEEWIAAQVRDHGLDYRIGYLVKLADETPTFVIVKRDGLSLS